MINLDNQTRVNIANYLASKGYIVSYGRFSFYKQYKNITYYLKFNNDTLRLDPYVSIRPILSIGNQKQINDIQAVFNKAKEAASAENKVIRKMINE